MVKDYIIYHSGGDKYYGRMTLSKKGRKQQDYLALTSGHIGYLSGYYSNDYSGNTSVVVYFKEKPSWNEILKRRNNGFKGARWYSINAEYRCPNCGSTKIVIQGYVNAEWEIASWRKSKEGWEVEDIVNETEDLGDSEFWGDEPLRCRKCNDTFNYPKVVLK